MHITSNTARGNMAFLVLSESVVVLSYLSDCAAADSSFACVKLKAKGKLLEWHLPALRMLNYLPRDDDEEVLSKRIKHSNKMPNKHLERLPSTR